MLRFDVILVLAVTQAIDKQLEWSNLSNEYVCAQCLRLTLGELLTRLTVGVKWAHEHKMMLVVMSACQFNFTHQGTRHGRHLQYITNISRLVKLQHTSTLYWSARWLSRMISLPICDTHQSMTFTHRDCSFDYHYRLPNPLLEPLPLPPSISAGLARKKKPCRVSLSHTSNQALSMENWTATLPVSPRLLLSPSTTAESVPTHTDTSSCQGSAHHAFCLSVNGQSRRHHANMAATEQVTP